MGMRQRLEARMRATHDLRIADNTYETVEASYQLRNLMKDAATSFEAPPADPRPDPPAWAG